MKIRLSLNYKVDWGQQIYILGIIPELGNGNEDYACLMQCISDTLWSINLDVKQPPSVIEYKYLVKDDNGVIIRQEEGPWHSLSIYPSNEISVFDYWKETHVPKPFFSSAFTNSFKCQQYTQDVNIYSKTLLLYVNTLIPSKDQVIVVSGNISALGNWEYKKELELKPIAYGTWVISFDVDELPPVFEYKFMIYDQKEQQITYWEECDNRSFVKPNVKEDEIVIIQHQYQSKQLWKAAGVAIPVFSLRSKDSLGVGEFSDLKKMIDWAVITGQKIIQILPINDTTVDYSWKDSYPYSAISIYALHPIYLGLKQYPLKDKEKYNTYLNEFFELDGLEQIDYEKVLQLKLSYIRDLFNDIGQQIVNSTEFKSFYDKNEYWLFPYACFCCLRDQYQTADFSKWENFSKYDKKQLHKWVKENPDVFETIQLSYFIQYLLYLQLKDAKEYAHQNGVVLKGDIPIGVNRYSVGAWTEPHLFNLDVQTGAPPDDFSQTGQNWGFPTYNWSEMAKDNYKWWTQRFQRMSDYFDIYRIDHILGFFRIWEIPDTSVDASLGYFNPALPLSVDEIEWYSFSFDKDWMTTPYVHKNYLPKLFGAYTTVVIENYLDTINSEYFSLKPFCNTQVAIKELFEGRNDIESKVVRDGLYHFCNEVLFVKDKYQTDKYHPRISIHKTFRYDNLSDHDKNILDRIYEDFYYHRHNEFWRDEAMRKLPVLLSSTNMMVCAEDLGMIPACVPDVIKELEMLSLEVERMPKELGRTFANLHNLPYLSVCTTSTHDMRPIRTCWEGEPLKRQLYYNEVLGREGIAPTNCTIHICSRILYNHLASNSMLTIFPLQDWLSINTRLRKNDSSKEQINIPSVSNHYWRYRMHLNIEDLIKADDLNAQILYLLDNTARR